MHLQSFQARHEAPDIQTMAMDHLATSACQVPGPRTQMHMAGKGQLHARESVERCLLHIEIQESAIQESAIQDLLGAKMQAMQMKSTWRSSRGWGRLWWAIIPAAPSALWHARTVSQQPLVMSRTPLFLPSWRVVSPSQDSPARVLLCERSLLGATSFSALIQMARIWRGE